MFKSIRWTLQLWHAGILGAALAGLGTAMYVAAYRTTYTEVDNELEAAGRVLATPPLIAPESSDLPKSSNPRLIFASKQAIQDPPGASGQNAVDWLKNMPRDCLRRLGWDERDQPYFIVWASDGSLIRNSLPSPDVPYPGAAPVLAAGSSGVGDPVTFRQRNGLREVIMKGRDGSTILVGRSILREQAGLASLRWSLLGAGAAVLTIGLLGSWVLSARVLRPIRAISDTASAISASDLSQRIDTRQMQSELGSLAQTLNSAFDRLEDAFDRQVQFVADASHELRTPLSVIHTSSELALDRPRTCDEYRQTIETILRASRAMKSLVESLLVLARADADALELQCDRLDLRQLVAQCVVMLTPMAQQGKVRVQCDGESVCVDADRGRIRQLITNLLSNAIKYNREGGSVGISLAGQDGLALLKVTDTGIGIALQDQPHIFERFFRADKARAGNPAAAGLAWRFVRALPRPMAAVFPLPANRAPARYSRCGCRLAIPPVPRPAKAVHKTLTVSGEDRTSMSDRQKRKKCIQPALWRQPLLRRAKSLLPMLRNRFWPARACASEPSILETLESRTMLSANPLGGHVFLVSQPGAKTSALGGSVGIVAGEPETQPNAKPQPSVAQSARPYPVQTGLIVIGDAMLAAPQQAAPSVPAQWPVTDQWTSSLTVLSVNGATIELTGVTGANDNGLVWAIGSGGLSAVTRGISVSETFSAPAVWLTPGGTSLPVDNPSPAGNNPAPQKSPSSFMMAAVLPAPVAGAQPSAGPAHRAAAAEARSPLSGNDRNGPAIAESAKPLTAQSIPPHKSGLLPSLLTREQCSGISVITLTASDISAAIASHRTDCTLGQDLSSVANAAGLLETFLIADARALAQVANSAAARIYAEDAMIARELVAFLGAGILVGVYVADRRSAARREERAV